MNFLGLSAEEAGAERARVTILPVPLEATVTYGGGTSRGPAAILEASCQVELYDRELACEPVSRYGVRTLEPPPLPVDPERAVELIAGVAREVAAAGQLLVGLGGEHTATVGLLRGVLAGGHRPLTVVQIDAHADLRDSYQDSVLSHACVARRLLEEPGVEQILQLGVRSVSAEEIGCAREHPDRVRIWYVEEVHQGAWREELAARVAGRLVYLTIDVDGLDPSLVPATGTPEPDGLGWVETLEILRTVATGARIVALDCVELAPAPGLHAADYAVAKLLYKAISYAFLLSPHASR